MAQQDVALYGGLCALATLDRCGRQFGSLDTLCGFIRRSQFLCPCIPLVPLWPNPLPGSVSLTPGLLPPSLPPNTSWPKSEPLLPSCAHLVHPSCPSQIVRYLYPCTPEYLIHAILPVRPRSELQSRVISNIVFKEFLEVVPEVRVGTFMGGHVLPKSFPVLKSVMVHTFRP